MSKSMTWKIGGVAHHASCSVYADVVSVSIVSAGLTVSFSLPVEAALQFTSQIGLLAMEAMQDAEENHRNHMRLVAHENT